MLLTFPYKILVEKNAFIKTGSMLGEMNIGKKFAIICSENIRPIAKKLKSSVKMSCDIIIHDSVEKKSLENLAKSLKKYDFVIGLGGGKTIDIAKYSAFLAKKPWISFPTIPSHDGVVSSRAVLDEEQKKISVDASEPAAIIADLDTLMKAPYRFTAAGAGDLISNISAVMDWKLAGMDKKEKYNTIVAELALLSAKAVANHFSDIKNQTEHGMEILMWSLISSGFAMNLHGSSRPCSGGEHSFSHALDRLGSRALHGEQVALGTIITTYLHGGDWKMIRNLLKVLSLPTTAKELDVSRETIIKAVVMAKDIRNRYGIFNKANLDEKKAEKILKVLGII
jgi:glycerol-1-phosphate dehydrogenase [NAD(P)+]